MANIQFFYNNLWDAQNIESSSETTNYPDTNTQHRWKSRPWRSTDVSAEYIRTDGGSSLSAAGFFIFAHNVTSSGTVMVKGSDDNWASTPFEQVMTRTGDLFVYIPSVPVEYDDLGFFFSDVTNTDGYIEIGRIWFGEYWEPTIGYSPTMLERMIDPSSVMTSSGGQKSILEKEKYKVWDMVFECITDALGFNSFFDSVGNSREFVILKKPKNYYMQTYPNPENNSFYVSAEKINVKFFVGEYITVSMKLAEEQ
jgi:hypothetical protein